MFWDSGNGFNEWEQYQITGNNKTNKPSIDSIYSSSIKDTLIHRSIALPQLNLKKIRIIADLTNAEDINVKIKLSNNSYILPEIKYSNTIEFNETGKFTREFHILLFLIQLIISLIITFLISEIHFFYLRFKLDSIVLTLKNIFIEQKRIFFWSMFIISVLIYSMWLIGQYPGAMSYDSLLQWYQAKTLIITNIQPYLQALYLLALMQIYDSPASVAMIQILAVSLLSSYIFYFIIKNNGRIIFVLPFFILILFSIPIGLHNITLWKDVPFSLLTAFWAFYIFYLHFNKNNNIQMQFSYKKIILLSILFIYMVLIRKNGIIFLFVLPMILIFLKLIPIKKLVLFIATSSILYFSFNFFIPSVASVEQKTQNYFYNAMKMNFIMALFINNSNYGNGKYITDNYLDEKKTIEKIVSVDSIKQYYYQDNYTGIIDEKIKSYNQFNPEMLSKLNAIFYKRLPMNLDIFFADRNHHFFALVSSLNRSTWYSVIQSKYFHNYDIVTNENGGILLKSLHSSEISYLLTRFQNNLLFKINNNNYINLFVWDLFIPLLILLLIFYLYKWLPISAVSSLFVLSQLPVIYIGILCPDWRYMYFIYLYVFFAVPLSLLELFPKKKM
jgi:hypothetical protein